MTLPTRAISLRQPWAWAVVHAGKNVENRTWYSTIRGPIWIASSAQVTRAYFEEARNWLHAQRIDVPKLDDLVLGAIIGRAELTGCILPGGYASEHYPTCKEASSRHAANGANWGGPLARHPLHPSRFHFIGQYGYDLENVEPVRKPVPCSGLQRWWTLPDDLLTKLREVAA